MVPKVLVRGTAYHGCMDIPEVVTGLIATRCTPRQLVCNVGTLPRNPPPGVVDPENIQMLTYNNNSSRG